MNLYYILYPYIPLFYLLYYIVSLKRNIWACARAPSLRVSVLAIHRQIYRTHGSEIVYMGNRIPEDVHLKAKFQFFHFKEELTQGCADSWKSKYYFFISYCFHIQSLVTKIKKSYYNCTSFLICILNLVTTT